MKEYQKLIIAIDFDGVIAEVNKDWTTSTPNIPKKLITDAVKYITKLHEDGHNIIIWTSRSGENLELAKKFIEDNNIPFDKINDNIDSVQGLYKTNPRKVYADIYIDDKQIGGIPTWKEMYNIINKFANESV